MSVLFTLYVLHKDYYATSKIKLEGVVQKLLQGRLVDWLVCVIKFLAVLLCCKSHQSETILWVPSWILMHMSCKTFWIDLYLFKITIFIINIAGTSNFYHFMALTLFEGPPLPMSHWLNRVLELYGNDSDRSLCQKWNNFVVCYGKTCCCFFLIAVDANTLVSYYRLLLFLFLNAKTLLGAVYRFQVSSFNPTGAYEMRELSPKPWNSPLFDTKIFNLGCYLNNGHYSWQTKIEMSSVWIKWKNLYCRTCSGHRTAPVWWRGEFRDVFYTPNKQ